MTGSDPDGDPVSLRVSSLPFTGTLYQYTAGGRGAPITISNSPITDPFGRLIFISAPQGSGPGYAAFSVIATDGNTDSLPATVLVDVLGLPRVNTMPATQVLNSRISLHAIVRPNSFPGDVWFEWGTTTNYGAITARTHVDATANPVNVNAFAPISQSGVVYHFRAVATNAAGLVYGRDQQVSVAKVIRSWVLPNAPQDGTSPPVSNGLTAVSVGANHCLGITTNGSVLGWGANDSGQISIPFGLGEIVAVTAGYDHSLALRSNGTVSAWGNNGYGQCSVPANLSDAVSLAAGYGFSLALRSDGSVLAWGRPDMPPVPRTVKVRWRSVPGSITPWRCSVAAR